MPRLKPIARDEVLIYARKVFAVPKRAVTYTLGYGYRIRPTLWQQMQEALGVTQIVPLSAGSTCKHCGAKFVRNHRQNLRLCSNRCILEQKRERARTWAAEHYEPRQREAKPATCAHCGGAFEARRADARFCSVRCRVAAHRGG